MYCILLATPVTTLAYHFKYAKGTDSEGIQKDMSIATWNGRTVLIDDDVPFDSATGAYTTYILGNNALDYCDVGAKVPNETKREAFTNGGEDYLKDGAKMVYRSTKRSQFYQQQQNNRKSLIKLSIYFRMVNNKYCRTMGQR